MDFNYVLQTEQPGHPVALIGFEVTELSRGATVKAAAYMTRLEL